MSDEKAQSAQGIMYPVDLGQQDEEFYVATHDELRSLVNDDERQWFWIGDAFQNNAINSARSSRYNEIYSHLSRERDRNSPISSSIDYVQNQYRAFLFHHKSVSGELIHNIRQSAGLVAAGFAYGVLANHVNPGDAQEIDQARGAMALAFPSLVSFEAYYEEVRRQGNKALKIANEATEALERSRTAYKQ